MGAADPKGDRIDELEKVWALMARVLAFVLGAVVLLGLVFFVEDRPVYAWLIVLALMGPTFAASMATMLSALRGTPAPPAAPENGA